MKFQWNIVAVLYTCIQAKSNSNCTKFMTTKEKCSHGIVFPFPRNYYFLTNMNAQHNSKEYFSASFWFVCKYFTTHWDL